MAEIVIPMAAWVHNQQEIDWLGEAIDSVLRSTFTSRELVVVDDASPIDLGPILAGLPIKYLRMQKHAGPAAARNVAVRVTDCPWIFCLDADDKLKPDALDKLYAAREENRFVYGDLEFTGDRTGFYLIADWSLDELRRVTGPIGVTALQSRKVWRSLSGWREDLAAFEDIEYWIRAAECGITGKKLSGALFEYRIHADSRMARMRERKTAQQVIAQIQELHKPFLNGAQTPRTRKDMLMVSGKIQVEYVGLMLAGASIPGLAPSGAKYAHDGKGSRLWIDARDADWITAFHDSNGPIFRLIVPEPVIQPVVQPAVDFSAIEPVVSEVPDVTTMNVKQAEAAIAAIDNEPDLRVVEALENGTEKRTTVLRAIERRRKEL